MLRSPTDDLRAELRGSSPISESSSVREAASVGDASDDDQTTGLVQVVRDGTAPASRGRGREQVRGRSPTRRDADDGTTSRETSAPNSRSSSRAGHSVRSVPASSTHSFAAVFGYSRASRVQSSPPPSDLVSDPGGVFRSHPSSWGRSLSPADTARSSSRGPPGLPRRVHSRDLSRTYSHDTDASVASSQTNTTSKSVVEEFIRRQESDTEFRKQRQAKVLIERQQSMDQERAKALATKEKSARVLERRERHRRKSVVEILTQLNNVEEDEDTAAPAKSALSKGGSGGDIDDTTAGCGTGERKAETGASSRAAGSGGVSRQKPSLQHLIRHVVNKTMSAANAKREREAQEQDQHRPQEHAATPQSGKQKTASPHGGYSPPSGITSVLYEHSSTSERSQLKSKDLFQVVFARNLAKKAAGVEDAAVSADKLARERVPTARAVEASGNASASKAAVQAERGFASPYNVRKQLLRHKLAKSFGRRTDDTFVAAVSSSFAGSTAAAAGANATAAALGGKDIVAAAAEAAQSGTSFAASSHSQNAGFNFVSATGEVSGMPDDEVEPLKRFMRPTVGYHSKMAQEASSRVDFYEYDDTDMMEYRRVHAEFKVMRPQSAKLFRRAISRKIRRVVQTVGDDDCLLDYYAFGAALASLGLLNAAHVDNASLHCHAFIIALEMEFEARDAASTTSDAENDGGPGGSPASTAAAAAALRSSSSTLLAHPSDDNVAPIGGPANSPAPQLPAALPDQRGILLAQADAAAMGQVSDTAAAAAAVESSARALQERVGGAYSAERATRRNAKPTVTLNSPLYYEIVEGRVRPETVFLDDKVGIQGLQTLVTRVLDDAVVPKSFSRPGLGVSDTSASSVSAPPPANQQPGPTVGPDGTPVDVEVWPAPTANGVVGAKHVVINLAEETRRRSDALVFLMTVDEVFAMLKFMYVSRARHHASEHDAEIARQQEQFQPHLPSRSVRLAEHARGMLNARPQSSSEARERLYERLTTDGLDKRQRFVETERRRKREQERKQCTFQPRHNKRSFGILKTMGRIPQDAVPAKTIIADKRQQAKEAAAQQQKDELEQKRSSERRITIDRLRADMSTHQVRESPAAATGGNDGSPASSDSSTCTGTDSDTSSDTSSTSAESEPGRGYASAPDTKGPMHPKYARAPVDQTAAFAPRAAGHPAAAVIGATGDRDGAVEAKASDTHPGPGDRLNETFERLHCYHYTKEEQLEVARLQKLEEERGKCPFAPRTGPDAPVASPRTKKKLQTGKYRTHTFNPYRKTVASRVRDCETQGLRTDKRDEWEAQEPDETWYKSELRKFAAEGIASPTASSVASHPSPLGFEDEDEDDEEDGPDVGVVDADDTSSLGLGGAESMRRMSSFSSRRSAARNSGLRPGSSAVPRHGRSSSTSTSIRNHSRSRHYSSGTGRSKTSTVKGQKAPGSLPTPHHFDKVVARLRRGNEERKGRLQEDWMGTFRFGSGAPGASSPSSPRQGKGRLRTITAVPPTCRSARAAGNQKSRTTTPTAPVLQTAKRSYTRPGSDAYLGDGQFSTDKLAGKSGLVTPERKGPRSRSRGAGIDDGSDAHSLGQTSMVSGGHSQTRRWVAGRARANARVRAHVTREHRRHRLRDDAVQVGHGGVPPLGHGMDGGSDLYEYHDAGGLGHEMGHHDEDCSYGSGDEYGDEDDDENIWCQVDVTLEDDRVETIHVRHGDNVADIVAAFCARTALDDAARLSIEQAVHAEIAAQEEADAYEASGGTRSRESSFGGGPATRSEDGFSVLQVDLDGDDDENEDEDEDLGDEAADDDESRTQTDMDHRGPLKPPLSSVDGSVSKKQQASQDGGGSGGGSGGDDDGETQVGTAPVSLQNE